MGYIRLMLSRAPTEKTKSKDHHDAFRLSLRASP
jgi:hypothetical protein